MGSLRFETESGVIGTVGGVAALALPGALPAASAARGSAIGVAGAGATAATGVPGAAPRANPGGTGVIGAGSAMAAGVLGAMSPGTPEVVKALRSLQPSDITGPDDATGCANQVVIGLITASKPNAVLPLRLSFL